MGIRKRGQDKGEREKCGWRQMGIRGESDVDKGRVRWYEGIERVK